MKSAPAITFDYRPSRWLALGICMVVLAALVALVQSGIDAWLKFGIAAAACVYAAHSLRNLLYSPMRRIAWHTAGHWRIAEMNGGESVAELQHAVARGGWIILTLLCSDGRRVPIVLAPDNCASDVRRRLRVRLTRADKPAAG